MSQQSSNMPAYIAVFVTLLVLTGVTVAAAYVNLGHLGPVVAVAIAGFKATLVGAYFMHLRHSGRIIVFYALSGVMWLGIMLGITMSEVSGRAHQGSDPLPPAQVHVPVAH